MKSITTIGKDPDPRFTLANERTFLAWIRTSMALILGAIVVATLLAEVQFLAPFVAPLSAALSLMGASLGLWAWFRWKKTETALRLGNSLPLSRVLLILALVISLLGITMLVVGIELALGA